MCGLFIIICGLGALIWGLPGFIVALLVCIAIGVCKR